MQRRAACLPPAAQGLAMGCGGRSLLLPQVASPAHEQVVLAHVRLLWPVVKEQPVAAHCTCTRGLATTKPMPQLELAAAHCTTRLPGSSRPLSRSPGGRSQANDFSWKPGSKASELLQVAAALPVAATQAPEVWHRAQPGPAKPSGQVTARGRRHHGQERTQRAGPPARQAGGPTKSGVAARRVVPTILLCERGRHRKQEHEQGCSDTAGRPHDGERARAQANDDLNGDVHHVISRRKLGRLLARGSAWVCTAARQRMRGLGNGDRRRMSITERAIGRWVTPRHHAPAPRPCHVCLDAVPAQVGNRARQLDTPVKDLRKLDPSGTGGRQPCRRRRGVAKAAGRRASQTMDCSTKSRDCAGLTGCWQRAGNLSAAADVEKCHRGKLRLGCWRSRQSPPPALAAGVGAASGSRHRCPHRRPLQRTLRRPQLPPPPPTAAGSEGRVRCAVGLGRGRRLGAAVTPDALTWRAWPATPAHRRSRFG